MRRLRVVGPVKTSEAARSQRRLALDRPYITTFCHGGAFEASPFRVQLARTERGPSGILIDWQRETCVVNALPP